MIKKMNPNQHDLVRHMLESLETPSRELTKWEEGFIESITEQYQGKGWLSDKQIEILEKIYSEKTS
jgi:hypothetical protein